MARSKRGTVEDLTAVVQEVARDLGPRTVATLASHPDAVRSALAVAADAISAADADRRDIEVVSGAEPRLVGAKEARRRTAAKVRRDRKEELLSSDQFAARAGLGTRQSVHDWLRKGKVLGWQGAKRGYVFPAGQLDGRGQPPMGLDRIVPLFEDGYAAWVWLRTPRAALDGETPLARLRGGEVDRVVAAAQGDVQGDFA